MVSDESIPSFLERVLLAREGAEVERCHVHPHLMRYSIGHHSLNVAMLLTFAWAQDHGGTLPTSALIVRAMAHDLAERITGDLPQPVKVILGDRLEKMEADADGLLGLPAMWLDPEEELYLACADRLELWLWSYDEAQRGNSYFMQWVADYDAHFEANPPPPAFGLLMEQVRMRGGTWRIPFARVVDRAGNVGWRSSETVPAQPKE